jgi:hypothetical protein
VEAMLDECRKEVVGVSGKPRQCIAQVTGGWHVCQRTRNAGAAAGISYPDNCSEMGKVGVCAQQNLADAPPATNPNQTTLVLFILLHLLFPF